MSTSIPKEIIEPLTAVLKRVRRMQMLRGLAGVAIVLLGGLLVAMAADFVLAPLPVLVRWLLLAALVAGTLVAAWGWLVKPLRQRITLVQIARWLETRHPEIQERVSTALELSDHKGGGVSESLLEELVLEAQSDVKGVDPEIEVRSKRVQRWLWPAAGLAVVFLLLFAMFPGELQRLFVRAVAPFTDLGNAGAVRFTIAPRDVEVLEGAEVKIAIGYSDPKATELTLVMEREGMETLVERLDVTRVADGVSEFEYFLPAARDSFHYYARIGKAQSDGFDVTVWPLPRLDNVEVEYRFPEYTDRAPQRRSLGQGVAALAGTEVRLEAMANTPVESGKFLVDGNEAGSVTVEKGAQGGQVAVNWTLMPEKGGLGQIMLQHRLGREIEGARFPVKVQPDQAPRVVLLAPGQSELRLRPDERVLLEYEVQEDVGVRNAMVDLQVDGRGVDPLPADLPEEDPLAARPLWSGQAEVSIGELMDKWPKMRELRMRMAVSDVLPEVLGGPGIGYSEWRTIRIDRNAESLARQEMRAQQSDVRETLNEAMNEVRQAQERMEWHKNEVQQEALDAEAEKHFAEAREQLASAREDLMNLAQRMERGVQAGKSDEVREAAQQVAESRERLEDTPLQDTAEGRQNELQQARDAAREAMQQLQDLQQEVQQDEGKIDQLAQLSELARQESEIARQAQNAAQEQGQQAPADQQLQQQQEQVESALRNQVNENPQSRAEMLERQANAAQELAEQAQELAGRQEALSETAEAQAAAQQEANEGQPQEGQGNEGEPQQGEPQEAQAQEAMSQAEERLAEQVREQLAAQQEEIVGDAQARLAEARQNREERANLLPEAVGQAEDTLEAIRENQTEAAAESAGQAAAALEDLAQPVGSESDGGSEGEAGSESEGEGEGGEEAGSESEGEGESEGETGNEGEGPQSGEGEGESESAGAEEAQGEGTQQSEEGSEGEGQSGSEGQGEGQAGAPQGQSGQGEAGDPELADLAERQGAVAEALEALQAGQFEDAMQAVQEMQAGEAAALAEAIENLPQVNGQSGAMAQAAQQSQQGSEQAQQASQAGQQGEAQAAAQQHAQASQSFEGAAEALGRAAGEFAQQAQQAAGQQPGQNQLPVPPEPMAEALQAAAQAADAQMAGQQAQASQQAAQALSQAAQQAMQAMQSGQQPGQQQPGQQPGQPGQQPGQEPQEGVRPQQGDPGVPPELAELGVSAKDWEQLKELLRSDVAGGGGAGVPEDYRGLVKRYFQEVAKGGK